MKAKKPTTRITIVSNATIAKLIDAPREVQMLVSEKVSYSVAGYEHTRLGARSGWDGRSSFFSFKTQTFPAGFARSVVGALTKQGYLVNWVKKPLPAPLGVRYPAVDDFGYDEKYSYQPEAVDKLVKYGGMVANLATGAGKSRVARIAYKTVQRKTLFITTRSSLMYQMKRGFERLLDERVGVVGDGIWEPCNGFNVAMVQTLAMRLEKKTFDTEMERMIEAEDRAIEKKVNALKTRLVRKKVQKKERAMQISKYRNELIDAGISEKQLIRTVKEKVTKHNAQREVTIEFLKSIEFIVLEEAHEAGGNGYYNVCMQCTNAYYRLALTGTAFQRSDGESNMRLMAVSGPIGIRVTEKQLIDLGVLATPIFCYQKVPPTKGLYRSTSWTKAYDIGIVNNAWRNARIVEHCALMKRYGLTSMILVLRKNHGELLKKQLIAEGLKVSFIFGDKSEDERAISLDKLGTGEIDVLIGTSILDVGVDVPSVGSIVLAGGGKAEIGLRQRIGRGLRNKKTGPNICFVLDFNDRHNNHLTEHSVTRRKIIHDTPGFSENVVEEFGSLEKYGFKSLEETV